MRFQLLLTNKNIDVANLIKAVKKEGRVVTQYIVESIRIRDLLEKKYGTYEEILVAIGSNDTCNNETPTIEDKVQDDISNNDIIKKRQEAISGTKSSDSSLFSDFDKMFDN